MPAKRHGDGLRLFPQIFGALGVAPVVADGTSTRVLWRAELTDIKALCAAVAAGTVPDELVQFNQAAGNRLATALKGSVSYPGVKFTSTESMAVRS